MPKFAKEVFIKGQSVDVLYERVVNDLSKFLNKTAFGHAELFRDDAQKILHFKASMAEGEISCHEGRIRVDAKISLFTVPFKSKIDETIDHWVESTFPGCVISN